MAEKLGLEHKLKDELRKEEAKFLFFEETDEAWEGGRLYVVDTENAIQRESDTAVEGEVEQRRRKRAAQSSRRRKAYP